MPELLPINHLLKLYPAVGAHILQFNNYPVFKSVIFPQQLPAPHSFSPFMLLFTHIWYLAFNVALQSEFKGGYMHWYVYIVELSVDPLMYNPCM
jgi:hypothetical protein